MAPVEPRRKSVRVIEEIARERGDLQLPDHYGRDRKRDERVKATARTQSPGPEILPRLVGEDLVLPLFPLATRGKSGVTVLLRMGHPYPVREREHVIVLSGPDFRGSFFRPEAMGRFERSLPDALLNASRMRFFASSRKIGRPGLGIERATELWIGDIREHEPTGGTQVTARLPVLGEAAPDFFQQPALFDQPTLFGPEPTPETTALDLLGDAIRAVAAMNADSELFDRGMLRRLPMLRPEGVESMTFTGRDLLFSEPAIVDASLEQRARDLSEGTPEPYRTRVMGRMEGIFHGSRAFVLKLRDGTLLRGLWTHDDAEPLRRSWGEDVLVEGLASFRPSGVALVLEADTIAPARDEDRFWDRAPRGVGPIRPQSLPGV